MREKNIMMKICVVDGQGGGIGSTIIRRLREAFGEKIEISGLGTNAIATSAMLKAGANRGATGENTVVRTVVKADLIVGSIGILMANSMLGEYTSPMAEAVSSAEGKKILIPISQENIVIMGTESKPLPHLVEELVETVRKEMDKDHV